ncbi:GT2 family glycosyltransferase [Janibacter cremeus]|uniref:GT2 family glycosyltransferase n=1 Tax=Janibacter cremeus TaxID=1285192 RepID=A0A852VUF2_9MICO|nr:GT2 family glycosyltransferase [Janibacter cremeus]
MLDCLLVVVSYRSASDVAGLLETVPAAAGDLSWHVVVVNNEPADDLARIVADHPDAELVESGKNVGYAGGINRGLLDAPPTRWTVFLNPDLRLGPGSIARLTEVAGQRDAAVPTIVDGEGVLQCSLRREPTILGSVGDAFFGDRWPGRPPVLGETIRDRATYAHPAVVAWATGALLVVPSAVVRRVGPWDSGHFFLYSEETDYCRRLRSLGVEVRFVPDAVVRHQGAGSGTSDALHALQEVNRVRYFRKWHGRLASAGFAGVVVLNSAIRTHRSQSRAALRALVSSNARASLPGGGR